MPVIPFLKGDKEREKERDREKEQERSKEDNSPASTLTASSTAPPTPGSGPTPSPQPTFNNPFSSPSAASVTTDSPNSTPSKYHPSRLLRRKASLSAKNANGEKDRDRESDVDPLPTGSSSTSFDTGPTSPRALPSSPRRLPSSPRGLPASPRTFFGFDATGDRDKEKYNTFPRRGSDVRQPQGSLGGFFTNGLPSPTASKRSAYVYNGRLTTEGAADEAVVIIPSARSQDDQDLSANLAALGLRSTSSLSTTEHSPPAALSSSVPKVVDGGFGLEHASGFVFVPGSGYGHEIMGTDSGMNVFGKIAKDQDALVDTRFTHNRPLTPPDSASYLHSTHPFYPTALSPPRRPMPKSPRAKANLRQRESSSPGPGPGASSSTPPSVGMMQATSAVGGSSSCVSPQQPPSPRSQRNTASPTPESSTRRSRPAITAEWLARKPSSASSTPSRLRHRPSLSVDEDQLSLRQQSNSSLRSSPSQMRRTESPNSSMYPSTPKRQGSLDASPDIDSGPGSRLSGLTSSSRSKPRSTSFSSTNSDTDLDPPSSDGEIGVNSRRRSLLATPSHSRTAKSPSPANAGAVSGQGGYEVEILCKDGRAGQPRTGPNVVEMEGGGEDEIRWEVIIRRQASRSTSQTPTSPLQLSTKSSIAMAPISASSINLSLSLDQPTGKLVFISFPMDIHATPTRRRRPSMNAAHGRTGSSSLSMNGSHQLNLVQQISSPSTHTSSPSPLARPSTPPMQTLSNLSSLNNRDTPTRTPSSRRKAPPAWPSPKAKLDQPSPSTAGGPAAALAGQSDQSPRDVFTPRKSRVTPSRLDGDLLNKVTNAD
ncbi:hypothetical protein IAU59_004634 [Kwoniella sp. CBS 9459]